MLRYAIIGALAAALSGCATEYHALDADGGYSERQIDANSWRVVFEGSGFTQAPQMEDFALLRSAELTLTKGYGYFSLASADAPAGQQKFKAEVRVVTMYKQKPDGGVRAYEAQAVCKAMQRKYDEVCR